jgi:hypothetical protein
MMPIVLISESLLQRSTVIDGRLLSERVLEADLLFKGMFVEHVHSMAMRLGACQGSLSGSRCDTGFHLP